MNLVERYVSPAFLCSFCGGPVFKGETFRLLGCGEKECSCCMEDTPEDWLNKYDDWAIRRA